MKRCPTLGITLIILAWLFATLFSAGAIAQEKLKYSTSVRLSPVFYLPVLAAQEHGIFKANGLEVEWLPFGSGGAHYRAYAAGAAKIGSTMVPAQLTAAARGVPAVIVSDLLSPDDFSIWVLTESRFKNPQDLKGAKIGVSRFGGTEHAYGRMIARALKLEKETKFISTGGIPESLAAMKTRAIDGVLLSPHQMINLMIAKQVRVFLPVEDYRAKPWAAYVIVARTDFVKGEPDTAKKLIKSILQANALILKDARWSLAKMKEVNGYSDEAAKVIYGTLNFSRDGKLDKKALENVRDFMIEYGIIKKEEAPSIDKIYTGELTG